MLKPRSYFLNASFNSTSLSLSVSLSLFLILFYFFTIYPSKREQCSSLLTESKIADHCGCHTT
ncbi:hypothetical protein CC77DRAFT_1018353 [Alternaria alternata]|jgi:hypothetical protein|uniref:Uncharacterized protein n=1 Tax=Alternaria alternata TaxID=5599 RepID=A0A177DX20_ALTAL|nr:hypothetical protein CC77DRAFT_1018353 [Alternaria alternata]OAG23542.1 hypothetical protein CC77DRAFT_1018353 [Alternaria alternata]